MGEIIEWYIKNYNAICISCVLLFAFILYIIKLGQKSWNFSEVKMEHFFSIFFSLPALPTSILLFICCFGINVLERVESVSIYIGAAAFALLFVGISTIIKFWKL